MGSQHEHHTDDSSIEVVLSMYAEELPEIIAYQNTVTNPDELIRAPYPASFTEEQVEQLTLLRENKAEYGDVIEEEIAKDGLVQALLLRRKQVGESRELVPTVRMRRTIVAAAYILEHTKSIESLPTKTTPPKLRTKTAAA